MRLVVATALLFSLALAGACKRDKEAESSSEPEPVPKSAGAGEEPEETAEDQEEAPDPKLVERGAYLASLGGCASCHTPLSPQGPDMSKLFAGGLEIKEAFGTWRTPNITPDRKTGIGDWSDEEIIAAIRQGKRPNGEQMYPVMPYMFYNALSDQDAEALVAFLRTLKPIENATEGNTNLKLPKPPAPEPSGEHPAEDDDVAQGRYLADLMHCAMCHTPMSKDGPDMSKAFAGGFVFEFFPPLGEGEIFSPNITQAKKTGIGKWTDEQIIAAVRQMKRPGDKPMIGLPMVTYMVGWRQLKDEDAGNLVAFLRSIKPIENKVPESTYKPSELVKGLMKKMGSGGAPASEKPKKE